MELPSLPNDIRTFVPYLQKNASTQAEVARVVEPYKAYESKLRQIFAQEPDHPATKANHLVPVFADNTRLTIRARDLKAETQSEKDKFLLPLSEKNRREHDRLATVSTLKHFRTNFNLFSESSLADLDWSNIVAAGSSVVTALLPVNSPHDKSKRALRAYYHEQLAPASDVDLFIYGLDEAQALEKIKQIEAGVRDSILSETTTIRTKNAITIVSEYPTRHVQIVLRLYKNITEILTGFDVDCACVAYDGNQVWAAPRALAAFATQTNSIDLTRRSPSYENRLSKYAHRGFEVFWPPLDREQIDPTIYERSFGRVVGLARLLVLEKLPHPSDRDQFLATRRAERGRPELPWNARYRHALPGNVKDAQPDDVAEWYDEDEVSSYHTFTIPYGPKYNAKRIEKLLFKKDLLLNAEWNRPKDRETKLHRHPAFFGLVEDVVHDCCGFCPEPTTDADLVAYEEESRLYISGDMKFMKDDPGRQAIGSFNPLTDDDWTDMAYVGSTSRLCQFILDNDLEEVKDWLSAGGDVNHRDHTGRTPLQLAVTSSTLEVVQCLIEHGARIVSRIYNGMTALHMAAHRGDLEIIKALLERSDLNEREEDRKEEARKESRRAAIGGKDQNVEDNKNEDVDMLDEDGDGDMEIDLDASSQGSVDDDDDMTEGSFVKIPPQENQIDADEGDEPDFYDIDCLAWDAPVSPLHLAILAGHIDVIKLLTDTYAADVMLPVKLMTDYVPREARAAILSLVLPLRLSNERLNETIATLLQNGASFAQADLSGYTALHYIAYEAKAQTLALLQDFNSESASIVINHLVVSGNNVWNVSTNNVLTSAISSGSIDTVQQVISMGANAVIDFETFARAWTEKNNTSKDPEEVMKTFQKSVTQPVMAAAQRLDLVDVVSQLLDSGADLNTVSKGAYAKIIDGYAFDYRYGEDSLLDVVRAQVKKMREFLNKQSEDGKPVKPEPLPVEAKTIPEDAPMYRKWLMRGNLASAEEIQQLQMEKYQKEAGLWKPQTGSQEKREIVQSLLDKWLALENRMVADGAKTLFELYPSISPKDNNPNRHLGYNSKILAEPYTNKTTFLVPDLTDTKKNAYFKLFEAAFTGDADTVKALCSEGEDGLQPLRIAVDDSAGFNPVAIALLRGHEDLANTMLGIAAAQYEPPEGKSRCRYSLEATHDTDVDDSESDGDEESGLRIVKHSVDEKFTIDLVLAQARRSKSSVHPANLLSPNCELWRFAGPNDDSKHAKALFQPGPRNTISYPYGSDPNNFWVQFNSMMENESNRCRGSLFRFAIATDNMTMLKFLLRTNKTLRYDQTDNSTLRAIQINITDYNFALRLGRIDMIGEIIKQTGALLPIQNLVKTSGVKIEAKPDHYQGLSVHGQKRADWTEQDRGEHFDDSANNGSPLLSAIFSGNLNTVEYFLSDTPMRQYEEFIQAFKYDKRIQTLLSVEGGIARTLSSWMDTRTNLALHMAVGTNTSESIPVLEYLVKKLPQYLDAKSDMGESPLQLAFRIKNFDAARILIKSGADQTTRNKQGQNLMHIIYSLRALSSEVHKINAEYLQKLVSMLKPDIVSTLLVQRSKSSSGSHTPLALFCDNYSNDLDVLKAMLNLSKGADLRIMDGAGDYLLHRVVRQTKKEVAEVIARQYPELMFWENATGMTPIDVAETAFLRQMMQHPPSIHSDVWGTTPSHKSILDKSAHEFEEGYVTKTDRPLHTMLRDIAQQAHHPRKLISLLDANEVARRLAEQQQRANDDLKRREALGLKASSRYSYAFHRLRDQQEGGQDEVAKWIGAPGQFFVSQYHE